ncbi:MAG: PHB depolymerase family esterase [Polyangiales bacterium]|nr:hypothetical protein [Sandaracinaceae bacterium]
MAGCHEQVPSCDVAPLPNGTCGLNGRGTEVHVCEGSQVATYCDDPDACVDGAWRMGSGGVCGLNDRGVEHEQCVAGQFVTRCQDPDACTDTEEGLSDEVCGLNGRGRRLQTCVAGTYRVNALSCADPDVCLDDTSSTRMCGENLRGSRTTTCVEGAWEVSACEIPSECLVAGQFDGGACPIVPPTLSVPNSCPDVSSNGRITIMVAGEAREFLLFLPPAPSGKPVAVLWHQLGGSASGFASITNASALASALDVIIAIPEMSYQFTLGAISVPMWRFLDASPPGPDLQLFDDILGCLDEEHGVDRTRLYAAGASAGALFSTRLLLDRADVLAGVAILSGGTDEAHRILNTAYVTPAAPTPTMVAWGGASDQLAFLPGFTIDFAHGSMALVDHLVSDGDTVVACDHGEGHSVPAHIIDFALEFLVSQRFGEPNPYAADVPPTLPSDCLIRVP